MPVHGELQNVDYLFDLRCAVNYSLTRHTVFKALSQVLDAI